MVKQDDMLGRRAIHDTSDMQSIEAVQSAIGSSSVAIMDQNS